MLMKGVTTEDDDEGNDFTRPEAIMYNIMYCILKHTYSHSISTCPWF